MLFIRSYLFTISIGSSCLCTIMSLISLSSYLPDFLVALGSRCFMNQKWAMLRMRSFVGVSGASIINLMNFNIESITTFFMCNPLSGNDLPSMMLLLYSFMIFLTSLSLGSSLRLVLLRKPISRGCMRNCSSVRAATWVANSISLRQTAFCSLKNISWSQPEIGAGSTAIVVVRCLYPAEPILHISYNPVSPSWALQLKVVMSKAKNFFVVFSKLNNFKPSLLQTKKSVARYFDRYECSEFKAFSDQIEAQHFIHPLNLKYLESKPQQVEVEQENPSSQAKPSYLEYLEESLVTNILKERDPAKKGKQKSINLEKEFKFQTPPSNESHFKNETTPKQQIPQYNDQNKLFSLKDFHELTGIELKQEAKNKLIQTYKQALIYQGSADEFKQSIPAQPVDASLQYYAYFDGCSKSNPGPAGSGYWVGTGEQVLLERAINMGERTNNEAEYFALLYCLIDCHLNGIRHLVVKGDSKLAIQGIKGKYKISAPKITYLNMLAIYFSHLFESFAAEHIYREDNTYADKLSNLALASPCFKPKN